jgi:hypothetical protein
MEISMNKIRIYESDGSLGSAELRSVQAGDTGVSEGSDRIGTWVVTAPYSGSQSETVIDVKDLLAAIAIAQPKLLIEALEPTTRMEELEELLWECLPALKPAIKASPADERPGYLALIQRINSALGNKA